MYGIMSLKNGEICPSAEFPAEPKKYGRGSACEACRIGRTKCSGALDSSDCNRCKRLGKSCVYTNKLIQRHHDGDNPLGGNNKDAASTEAASPEQENSDICSPSAFDSSELDRSSVDGAQFVMDDPFGFGFEGWPQLQSTPSMIEPFPPDTDLTGTLPRTECPSSLDFSPSYTKWPWGNGEVYEGSSSHVLSQTNRGTDNNGSPSHELVASKPFLHFEDGISDTQGSTCQYKCLQTITSSLSFLRSWAWSGGPGNSKARINGTMINCVRIEDVLSLFERSMAQLQIAESCPLACILSQDLAILLLLVVEQLAKLLLDLAAEPIGGSGEYTLDKAQERYDIRPARIGKFEITDPLDLQMIMKLLLQIRAQALDAYICRWCDKIKHCGFENLEADLGKICEDLSRAVFLDNIPQTLPSIYRLLADWDEDETPRPSGYDRNA